MGAKILILILMICASLILIYNGYKIRQRERTKMSFMEAFNLTEMTIVTLFNNGVKLNFLLDSGSNDSYISKSAAGIKGLEYKKIEVTPINITGSTGVCAGTDAICLPLSYRGKNYDIDMYVMEELDESFRAIKESDGVQIHGILGTKFLHSNNFVLDFDELVAYKKK